MNFTTMGSPLGPILLASDTDGLRLINFQTGSRTVAISPDWQENAEVFSDTVAQLGAYFMGDLTEFELTLSPQGSPFYREVWRELERIPYGRTLSYGELAERVGRPKAARAVGAANGRNPLPIVIPCHRVIGRDGSLTGYGGGLRFKKALLELERKHSPAGLGEQLRLELS
ncbi:MAG: methylated-DNA--[protein]-cysteine S-methyltransferase [Chloroflexi bacterium]|nr:methylated-DNA--[protein]-cysteine S-methyltransferase [Chloroflexota bacterium]